MRPIQRIKHVIDGSQAMTAGTQLNIDLVKAVDAPVLANRIEVVTGATVNAIYLRIEVASNEAQDVGAIPNCYLLITKNPGDNITIPAANAVGSSDNKRFVIHQEMVMFENNLGGNVRTLFNGVVVIPKGYRRFGPNDKLVMSILTTAVNAVSCQQCHYKEFR